ncbi:MAG: nucleoside hydrolase [Armatimonadetes bacterium]|nr:nucleoside hydrolase [Armatimonadota bacterium]
MPTTAARLPVLFDTDIGSDIDDAVALAYLLKQPRCELLGVTTVTGEVNQRAALVEIIAAASGRTDLPIHPGASKVIFNGPGQPHVPQYEAVRGRPHRTDYPPNTAIEFMRKTIRSRPGEVTLIAVGPMTNLALLFATDPEIPSLLRQVVLMCGAFTVKSGRGPGGREWNAMSDPLATAMTYKARPPRFTSFGLDVTLKCTLEAEECRQRFNEAGGALGVIGEMAEVWFRHSKYVTFHDPLAAAAAFHPDLCEYEDGEVTVDVRGPRPGITLWEKAKEEGPHRIAVEVDRERFFEEYFSVVNA